MGIAQRIEAKQQQRLAISPRVQQAISLLRLSGPELEARLEQEAEQNPLLALPQSRSRNDGFSALESLREAETPLEALHRQIGLMRLPAPVAALARALAGELSESGYLRSPVFELADRLKVRTCEVEEALAALQSCEPAGIGARSVAECLALQLKARGRYDPVIARVLENLDLVAAGDVAALSALTGEPEPAVQEMLAEIRALNPRPGSGLAPPMPQGAVPEVEVFRGEMGQWQARLLADALPKVLVDHAYLDELRAAGGAAAEFTRQNLEAANWLIAALRQRAQTILRVAQAIVAHQSAWFEQGDIAMRPLTLSMVAAETGMHESTISRVTAGKYLICPRGSFELKHFFTAKIAGTDKATAFSALSIRARIKHHIAQESYPKTLSDGALVKILRSEGVDIARRTVAKYREDMGIESSVLRRKKLRLRQVDIRRKRP